jgi:hypothetical protein
MLLEHVAVDDELNDTDADEDGDGDGEADGVTARTIDFFPIGGRGELTYALV